MISTFDIFIIERNLKWLNAIILIVLAVKTANAAIIVNVVKTANAVKIANAVTTANAVIIATAANLIKL